MKKNIWLLLMVFVILFVFASCGNEIVDSGEDLKLIYFNELKTTNSGKTKKAKVSDVFELDLENQEKAKTQEISIIENGEKDLTVQVINQKRYSFIDIVVYSEVLDKTVVFNEGHGMYQCASTTIQENEEWITDITLHVNESLIHLGDNCNDQKKLIIEEINFIDSAGRTQNPEVENVSVSNLSFKYDKESLIHYKNEEILIEPTCLEAGKKKLFCDCGYEKEAIVEATGHTMGEWEVITKETCTEEGEKIHKCNDCGFEEKAPIEATGHTMGEWEVVTEETCFKDGEKSRECNECGFVETEVIPKQHKEIVLDGLVRCDRCAACFYTEGLIFELKTREEYISENPNLASSNAGLEVLQRLPDVFYALVDSPDYKLYDQIYVKEHPSGLPICGLNFNSINCTKAYLGWDEVLDFSFTNCPNLETLTLPALGKYLKPGFLINCPSIKSITIPSSVEKIGVDYPNEFAIVNCDNLESIYYKGVITKWCEIANNGISNTITDLYILKNEEYVLGNEEYVKVTSLEIPSSVTNLSDVFFYQMQDVEEIVINNSKVVAPIFVERLEKLYFNGDMEDWIEFKTVNDGSFSNYNTTIYFNENGEYVSPKVIEIPSHYKKINSACFDKLYDVEELYILNPTLAIESYGGSFFPALERVYFNGTIDEWISFWNTNYNLSMGNYDAEVLINDGEKYNVVERIDLSNYEIENFSLIYWFKQLEEVIIPKNFKINFSLYNFEELKRVYFAGSAEEWLISRKNYEYLILPEDVNLLVLEGAEYSYPKKITIPSSFKNIERWMFEGFLQMEEITISSGCKSIGDFAFYDLKELKKVTISDTIKEIGDCIFWKELEYIVIPNSIEEIGDWNWSNMKILFMGTIEEWSKVTKGQNISNFQQDVLYLYSDTYTSDSGKWWNYGENNEIIVWEN